MNTHQKHYADFAKTLCAVDVLAGAAIELAMHDSTQLCQDCTCTYDSNSTRQLTRTQQSTATSCGSAVAPV
eukprot:3312-Heterococcus_DN1.PRE.3